MSSDSLLLKGECTSVLRYDISASSRSPYGTKPSDTALPSVCHDVNVSHLHISVLGLLGNNLCTIFLYSYFTITIRHDGFWCVLFDSLGVLRSHEVLCHSSQR